MSWTLGIVSALLVFTSWAHKCRDENLQDKSQTKIRELEKEKAGAAQRFSNLLSEKQAEHEANQKKMIQESLKTARSLSGSTAGAILALGRHVHDYKYVKKHNREAEIAALSTFQAAFLSTCVDTISRWENIEGLSANWCMREKDSFRVVTYDRHHPHRVELILHPIAPSAAGASSAFLTGETSLVSDTAQYPDVFSGQEPYKSILSIPALRGKGPDAVIGVVNIDSPTPGALSADHAHLIADLVSLIGLAELEKPSPTTSS